MSILDWLLGKRISTLREEQQQIGPLAGVSALGLDALSSAAYGPEAALTLLLPLGAVGLRYVAPISAVRASFTTIAARSFERCCARGARRGLSSSTRHFISTDQGPWPFRMSGRRRPIDIIKVGRR